MTGGRVPSKKLDESLLFFALAASIAAAGSFCLTAVTVCCSHALPVFTVLVLAAAMVSCRRFILTVFRYPKYSRRCGSLESCVHSTLTTGARSAVAKSWKQ